MTAYYSEFGTRVRGTRYASAKLNDDAVRAIRRAGPGPSHSELARRLNVSPAAVQAVRVGRTWPHVQ